jgi:hypothetical protein
MLYKQRRCYSEREKKAQGKAVSESCHERVLLEAVAKTDRRFFYSESTPRRSGFFLGDGLEHLNLAALISTEHEDAITRVVRDSHAS